MKRELILIFPIFSTFIFQFLAWPENHVLFEKDAWRMLKKKFLI